MTVDTRVANQGSGKGHIGYRIGFRSLDPYHQHSVVVDVSSGRMWLKVVNGDSMKATRPPTEPLRVRAIDRSGRVNRAVIHCVGADIRTAVNGEEVIRVTDTTFGRGRLNLVAAAWGTGLPEGTFNFDNIRIETPARR